MSGPLAGEALGISLVSGLVGGLFGLVVLVFTAAISGLFIVFEDQFGVGALPEQDVRQALLEAGADQEVDVARRPRPGGRRRAVHRPCGVRTRPPPAGIATGRLRSAPSSRTRRRHRIRGRPRRRSRRATVEENSESS